MMQVEFIGIIVITLIVLSLIAVWAFYFHVPDINSTVDSLRHHPQSRPAVVSSYTEQMQRSEKPSICVSISQVRMATNFEPSDAVESHIMSNTRLLIDGQVVPFWDVTIGMNLLGIDVF